MMSKLKLVLLAFSGWAMTAQVALANDALPPGQLPEPGTMALVGLGLAAAVVIARRRK